MPRLLAATSINPLDAYINIIKHLNSSTHDSVGRATDRTRKAIGWVTPKLNVW